MIAYHFTGETLRDGRDIPAVGEWLEFEGEIIPCKQGFHASEHPFDALQYAPGNLLHLVEIKGDENRPLLYHGDPVDKVAGCRRRILSSVNTEEVLNQFARVCALDVIHLWDAPLVVVDYLNTGKAELQEAAAAAARDAAWAAAAAARDAAWAAARDAAWDAARDAARDAAWAAARDAARDAAWAAAWAAARDAAWAAAWAAARDAAREKQRARFKQLVDTALDTENVLSSLK